MAVVVGGYGWLGYVAGNALGALVGWAAGLASSELLYVLIELAMSGMPPRRRSMSRPFGSLTFPLQRGTAQIEH